MILFERMKLTMRDWQIETEDEISNYGLLIMKLIIQMVIHLIISDFYTTNLKEL